jgi:hypothetical protein
VNHTLTQFGAGKKKKPMIIADHGFFLLVPAAGFELAT